MENERFLTEQIITYLGNKRKLLDFINVEIRKILEEMGIYRGRTCDLFSGSGVVARLLKQYSTTLYANDLESYSYVINDCYLTNKDEFNEKFYEEIYNDIVGRELISGIITKEYAPLNDNDIKEGERAFYTHENAMIIDTLRKAIDDVPQSYQKYFLAPLLYEASVHANTSGVFKGFYKSKTSGLGKFGGENGDALERIKGKIELKKPVFSSNVCDVKLLCEDANITAKHLSNIDIAYIDPPYNQHPYGSNYFMLNTILNNSVDSCLSKVAGIPCKWNKSKYNKKGSAFETFEDMINNIDSKYLIISYNNEGFIKIEQMMEMLMKYGKLSTKAVDYVAFRGGRKSKEKSTHTKEYIFTLKKG